MRINWFFLCITWEQRRLGELSRRIIRKNKNIESNLVLTISAQEGLISQKEFFDREVAGKDLTTYTLVKRDEFAYNKSYSAGYPWGAIKRLMNYNEGVVSSLYIVFSIDGRYVSFITHYFETSKWYKEIYIRASEGARNHGLLNISPESFFEMEVNLPSVEEGDSISNMIDRVANYITFHRCELNIMRTDINSYSYQVLLE